MRFPGSLLAHDSALVRLVLPASDSGREPHDTVRHRLTVVTGLCGGVAVLVAVLIATDDPPVFVRATSYGLSAGFFTLPMLLRAGVSPDRTHVPLLALMVGYAWLLAASTGGRDTGAVLVAFLVPLLATLLGGIRAGFAWTFVTCVCFGLLGAFSLLTQYVPPVQPDFEAVAGWNLWAAVIGMLGTYGVASAYEWLRDESDRRLREERHRSEQLSAEQKRADARFQAELEALVEERTRALEVSQLELRRAERLASIGTLAAGIAHQINNPLGTILLGTQSALQHTDPEDRERVWREVLARNEEAAHRCGRVVRSLLRFAASNSIEKTVEDLNHLASAAIDSLRADLGPDRCAGVEFRPCEQSIPIRVHPVEIEQLVGNLVENGIQASQDAAPRVRVRIERSGRDATLIVEDTGRGIPESDLPRIFDPFFSSRVRAGGTGLGLSVVHGIVRDHAGSIEVESEIDRGTRFTVRFPIENG